MEGMVQSISSSLAGGSLVTFLIMFGVGLSMSFNPCMGAMAPLVIGGSRQKGYTRSLLFMAGFTITLILLGLMAASLGKVLTLPGTFWTFFLGILYLIAGLIILRIKLPIYFSGFYVFSNRPRWFKYIANKEGLNPGTLGTVFALAPSPCTLPVIMAVSGYVLANGNLLFGTIALGAFGIGHSLPLALAFLPWVRNLFKPNRITKVLRPAMGIFLIFLALYFLIAHPDFFNSSMALHN